MDVAPSNARSATLSLDDEDESVKIAVRALGDMRSRSRANPSSVPLPAIDTGSSTQPTPALSTTSSPSLASQYHLPDEPNQQVDFVSRVSRIPLVTHALKTYESSKASSRMVKYGAEMMETSVRTISRPVMDRLPLEQLDEFASRQFDRFGGRYARSPSERDQSPERMDSDDRGRGSVPNGAWASGLQMRDVSMSGRERSRGSFTSPKAGSSRGAMDDDGDVDDTVSEQQQQVAYRSRWQTMLMEAGGISAAVSEESMRRLKYCLQWLQYATANIDNQITILRTFIASLQPTDGTDGSTALVTAAHMRTLNDVKRNVVDTIRQVVDVVSKYTGGALPEPARASVRQFILHLPQRWAVATHQSPAVDTGAGQVGLGDRSVPSTPGPSSPVVERQAQVGENTLPKSPAQPTASSATQAANRVLVLATESLDMMKGVTGVVKDSLDRAEAWIERLRVVGIQRQQQEAQGQGQPLQAADDNGVWDAPSPTVQTTHSFSALSLDGSSQSAYATPKTWMSDLPIDGRSADRLLPSASALSDGMATTPDGVSSKGESSQMELDT